MKTVLILRHAKSDWGGHSLADFERPLNKRGLEDAPRMGRFLATCGALPDKILASPAKRAKQTVELVVKASDYGQAVEWHDSFYEGNSASLLTALQHLPAEVERVMLVGHNPILEETVGLLCTDEEADAWIIKIPTAGLVCIELDIENWAEVEPGGGILRWFVIPKLVKALMSFDIQK